MYIYIFEDGTVNKTKTLSDGDLSSADDGFIDIIDISNPIEPKTYYSGQWHDLEEYKFSTNGE